MTDKRAAYFEEATGWALDREAQARRFVVGALAFAVLALLVAAAEAGALIYLTPLKTVTPIPVLVDRQTGFIEVLKPDGRAELRADQALTQSLLAQYVAAREGFNITDLGAEYRKVALWSAGGARQEFLGLMPASNPLSPLQRYPHSTIIEARIKSISPVGPMTSLVRFETIRRDADGRPSPPRNWAAVLTYKFTDAPMSVEDRLMNPLGFQVVRYHRDAETLTPPEQQEAPAQQMQALEERPEKPVFEPKETRKPASPPPLGPPIPPMQPGPLGPAPLGPPRGAVFLPNLSPPQVSRP